jgi:hypothetical protein
VQARCARTFFVFGVNTESVPFFAVYTCTISRRTYTINYSNYDSNKLYTARIVERIGYSYTDTVRRYVLTVLYDPGLVALHRGMSGMLLFDIYIWHTYYRRSACVPRVSYTVKIDYSNKL